MTPPGTMTDNVPDPLTAFAESIRALWAHWNVQPTTNPEHTGARDRAYAVLALGDDWSPAQ